MSCVYRTPGSDVDLFFESLEHIFTDVVPRKYMFICGDFNIDLMKYKTHNGTKRFLDSRVASVNRRCCHLPSSQTNLVSILMN